MVFKRILTTILVTALVLPASLAHANSPEILRWEELVAPKGFILSLYLVNEMGCSQIWTKQLPAFQARNLKVEDPDVIAPGEHIIVQRCKDKAVTVPVAAPAKKAEPQEEPIEQVGDINGPYLELYGGFLTENEKEDRVDAAYGLGVTGDLMRFLGYNMRLLGSEGALFLNGEVRFKTAPGHKFRGHVIFGLADRIGLQNRDLDRLNKGVDSYTYGGFGLEVHPSNRYRFGLDLTTNFNQHLTPNVGVYAQKRLGDDYWLGLYGEYNSTRSAVDSNEKDRRYLTGGIKFSF